MKKPQFRCRRLVVSYLCHFLAKLNCLSLRTYRISKSLISSLVNLLVTSRSCRMLSSLCLRVFRALEMFPQFSCPWCCCLPASTLIKSPSLRSSNVSTELSRLSEAFWEITRKTLSNVAPVSNFLRLPRNSQEQEATNSRHAGTLKLPSNSLWHNSQSSCTTCSSWIKG